MKVWVLYGRKITGRPFGGTWQARRSGTLRELWLAWWQEERHREFNAWKVRRRQVVNGVLQ